MQTLNWYLRRLGTMSPAEVAWRAAAAARGLCDRAMYPLLRRGLIGPSGAGQIEWSCRPRLADPATEGYDDAWRTRLIAKADAIAEGRLSFFDLDAADLGKPVKWNHDHKLGLDTPMGFAPAIDYRDVRTSGDCKFVWEPSRHHQLVALGRAYQITGEQRYAAAVLEMMQSWLDQCPFGLGMQWRSPMELSIRLINWVCALDLIEPSGLLTGELEQRVRRSICLHLRDVRRKYSKHSSANNHTIGEAAGVFIACQCLGDVAQPASAVREGAPAQAGLQGVAATASRSAGRTHRRRREAKAILESEIQKQSFADGGGGEQTVSYQLFVSQFLLLAGLVARQAGEDFSPAYWQRLELMFAFLAALAEGGESIPSFGDGDDGYVLDLGAGPNSYREWLAAAAVVFARADFAAAAGQFSETAWWLLGQEGRKAFDALLAQPRPAALVSRAFADTGLYLLQAGQLGQRDRISVTFDCGPHGLAPLAAHGHADALAITLRAFGVDVLVEAGTYDYFSYRPWREYFRSTAGHNTVEIDGLSQSEPSGLFMWATQARSRRLLWRQGELGQGGAVCGEHDGYARLADPVAHRRTVELDAARRELRVLDEIVAAGKHDAAVRFHLAEQCKLTALGGNRFEIDAGAGKLSIQLDSRLAVEVLAGSENPIGGWVSRGYHRKTASTTIVGRCSTSGEMAIETVVTIGD